MMKVEENVVLAPLTTFRIGGSARFFIRADSETDIDTAIALAREKSLPLLVLGGGSNILVPDEGAPAVVVRPVFSDITRTDDERGALLVAGAGARWDDVVDFAAAHGLFGIENLAGIPGSAAGAAVQNIGAYGAELSSVFAYADVIDAATGKRMRIDGAAADFGYRRSVFKKERSWIITRIALRFSRDAGPVLSYPDLARAREEGTSLSSPAEIAGVVRRIRAGKFPSGGEEGTAGSFFKNPVIALAQARELEERFPGLPVFSQGGNTAKISLAWILDRALSLKGYAQGSVRLYEKQPLVIVAQAGARARDVDALAHDVAKRVHEAIGITLEREVETFSENFSS